MNRKRNQNRTLTGTRIYIRRGKFQYYSPELMINPTTGKATRWHILCPVSDGELAARIALDAMLGRVSEPKGKGDFALWFAKWKTQQLAERNKKTPTDPARADIWLKGSKALGNVLGVIENALCDFDLVQIAPSDVAVFVDQWEGRRAAQVYRGHLVKFFAWCARQGLMNTNPASVVTVATPKKRKVYIDDKQYFAIQQHLRVGKDERPTRTGDMVCCYMDLLYLLYQRGTDVRLLKWSDVQGDTIKIKPSKTEHSSGAIVEIPISPAVRAVLNRARAIQKLRSVYVIATEHGQPYTAHGIGSLFERACERAGIKGVTLKDIRAKAATDAKRAGYSEEQLKVALAHTDTSTTRHYIRGREVPVSQVFLELPKPEK